MQTKQQVAAKQHGSVHAKNVANNAIVRMQQRVAAVQALRKSKHVARIAARQQSAFIAAVHQQAAAYGVTPEQVAAMLQAVHKGAPAARANSATQAPSKAAVVVNGVPLNPCKAVHALCAANPLATRGQVLALCAQHGINPATAATQYGVYKKQLAAQ